LRGGPRGFRPGFPCPAVLRSSSRKAASFRLRDCYPLWFDVPVDSANTQLCNFPTRRQTDQDEPYNPYTTTAAAYHVAQVWARSLFARHYSGSRGFFPFLRVLRCFSSPACLSLPYFVQAGVRAHYHAQVSPFGNPRINGWSAPSRGLSQPPTSFIGSWRQGIHRVPFVT
jgi:hypothetical protein